MDSAEFLARCKSAVADYVETMAPAGGHGDIGEAQVFCVWMCKTLQNSKALLATTIPDGLYYEVTFDGDRGEAYVDVYRKIHNHAEPWRERETGQ